MKNETIEQYLSGGDLRSIARVNALVRIINSQEKFDGLIKYLFCSDRLMVMRAADAIEKISIANRLYLVKHKKNLISLLNHAEDKELKWHLALIISRINLSPGDLGKVWQKLTLWLQDKNESRIVRVNALQGLYDLMQQKPELKDDLLQTVSQVNREEVPSLNARIRNLKF